MLIFTVINCYLCHNRMWKSQWTWPWSKERRRLWLKAIARERLKYNSSRKARMLLKSQMTSLPLMNNSLLLNHICEHWMHCNRSQSKQAVNSLYLQSHTPNSVIAQNLRANKSPSLLSHLHAVNSQIHSSSSATSSSPFLMEASGTNSNPWIRGTTPWQWQSCYCSEKTSWGSRRRSAVQSRGLECWPWPVRKNNGLYLSLCSYMLYSQSVDNIYRNSYQCSIN